MNEIIERKVDAAVKTVTKEFENKVISLESQVQHLKSVLNNDSTNSSLPTSRTPINKNKKIPNSIEKTNKKAGGQSGHTKHTLKQFDDNEIDEIIQHRIEECPICHSSMKDREQIRIKDEYTFDIIVKKVRHQFIETQCPQCGHIEKIRIPKRLLSNNQYGTGIQALVLTLMNEGYVSINRTTSIIKGLTHGQFTPSEDIYPS